MHRVAAVEARPGAGAAADRFVVLHAVVAEREVIHRTLRSGEGAERAVKAIRHALRCLDIAGDDRNVFPYTTYDEREHLDCSRLDQWALVQNL